MYEEQNLGRPPGRFAPAMLAHGGHLKLVSLSVQSLCKVAAHHFIVDCTAAKQIDAMALQETRTSAVTQYVVGDHLFVLAGHGGKGPEYAGVAIVLSSKARKMVTGFNYSGGGGRILEMGLDTAPRGVTIVAVYAPQSGIPEDERASFMDALGSAGAAVIEAWGVDGAWWSGWLERAGFLGAKPENHLFVYHFVLDPEHPLASAPALQDAASWYLTDGDRDDELMG